jgi:hypothetical protein
VEGAERSMSRKKGGEEGERDLAWKDLTSLVGPQEAGEEEEVLVIAQLPLESHSHSVPEDVVRTFSHSLGHPLSRPPLDSKPFSDPVEEC